LPERLDACWDKPTQTQLKFAAVDHAQLDNGCEGSTNYP
jgi:hypothetical protein